MLETCSILNQPLRCYKTAKSLTSTYTITHGGATTGHLNSLVTETPRFRPVKTKLGEVHTKPLTGVVSSMSNRCGEGIISYVHGAPRAITRCIREAATNPARICRCSMRGNDEHQWRCPTRSFSKPGTNTGGASATSRSSSGC
jgi:hypothetical protein